MRQTDKFEDEESGRRTDGGDKTKVERATGGSRPLKIRMKCARTMNTKVHPAEGRLDPTCSGRRTATNTGLN